MTTKQKIQLGVMAGIVVVGLLCSVFLNQWWQTLGLLCLIGSSLLAGSPRLMLLTPGQLYGAMRERRGPRVTLASQVLFFSGLALLLSGWFHR
ncbi:MAG: hypothetical protein JO184_09730 [Gammaproteobacteria bacterium]|nr:hypothetical protein [Gammaproteobacteria bacterium]